MSIEVAQSQLHQFIDFSKSLYRTISYILKLWAEPKQTGDYESVSFVEFVVRCIQNGDLNAQQQPSPTGVASTKNLDNEYGDTAKRLNEQRQRVLDLLQRNIPLIKARHIELDEKCSKARCATQDSAVDPCAQLTAEERSALFRLKGVNGVGPIAKYEKVLEDAIASMKTGPVIDANFVQHLTLIGQLTTIEKPIAEMLSIGEECEQCAREVGIETDRIHFF